MLWKFTQNIDKNYSMKVKNEEALEEDLWVLIYSRATKMLWDLFTAHCQDIAFR